MSKDSLDHRVNIQDVRATNSKAFIHFGINSHAIKE